MTSDKESQKRERRSRFIKKLIRSILVATCFIASSLFLGMWGYHHFERMGWLDAYVNASMILSGMGPLASPQTDEGKLFEGTYALFSGIIFLISVGVILAPVLRYFFIKLHLEELNDVKQEKKDH